jgi:hemolysin activation/secretion protein
MNDRRPPAWRASGFLAGAACSGFLWIASAPARADAPPPAHVDIEAYDVDGNTLLDQTVVEDTVYPFLGPDRTVDDVERARAALEKTYHDRGYQSVVVEVPTQNVADNIVRIHVVESPVGRLRVVGARYFSPSELKREIPSLGEGQTPDFNKVQAQMGDLNRLPDRQVTPTFKAGSAPGTVDVDLNVKDTLPLHASVELNNDHAEFTKPLRVTGTIQYGNLWQLGHSVSFTYQVAPQRTKDGQIFSASYFAPLWGTPWNLQLFGYTSNSNVASVGGATVLGKGYDIGLRATRQLPARGTFTQWFTVGVDYRNNSDPITLPSGISTGPAFITTPVPLDYWPFTAVYSLQRSTPKAEAKLSVSLTAGVRGTGSNTATFHNARADAHPNFVHANVDLDYQRTLWYKSEIVAHVSSQIADQPLVTTEEMAIGGATSVRGYYLAEEVGDSGVAGSIDLRSPPIDFLSPWIDNWRFYAFTDAARVWVLQPADEQAGSFNLWSAGVGTRFDIYRHLHGDVAIAWPFTAGALTSHRSPRAVVDLKTDF